MQLERWKPRMARKNIEYHFQAGENIPHILGDHRALDQVFTNLITNAIQAMQDQESGVIAINISTPAADKSPIFNQLTPASLNTLISSQLIADVDKSPIFDQLTG